MLRRIRTIDYIVLLCDDVARMKQFYTGVMGFSVYTDFPDWVELRVGSTLLTLRSRGREYDGVGGAGASVQLAFRVAPPEVDSCYAELVSRGVTILEGVQMKDYGHKTLFFADPENNVLEIYADI